MNKRLFLLLRTENKADILMGKWQFEEEVKILNIIYLSVSYKTGKETLYNDLVDELIKRGHSVTIVIPEKIEKSNYLEHITSLQSILHVKAGDWFSTNYMIKGISMLGFSAKMIKAINEHLMGLKYDLVLYATPPITFNKVVMHCKKKFNCKSFLMLKDIYPQGILDLGVLNKKNIVTKYFFVQEKKLFAISDKIGCMSKGNQDYIVKNYNIDFNKTLIFPNSIRIREYEIIEKNKKNTTFLFGGNLGAPQNISGLLDVVEGLRNFDKAKFIIVGKGKYDFLVKKYALESGNQNFNYYDFLEKKDYDSLLAKADVGLISLDPRFTIPNIPSKLQNYMNMKIPVLAITDTCSDIGSIIEEANCGWWVDAGDISKTISCIKGICKDKSDHTKKGENGFNFLSCKYDIKDNAHQLEVIIGGSNE